jgi:hypothetical protein
MSLWITDYLQQPFSVALGAVVGLILIILLPRLRSSSKTGNLGPAHLQHCMVAWPLPPSLPPSWLVKCTSLCFFLTYYTTQK